MTLQQEIDSLLRRSAARKGKEDRVSPTDLRKLLSYCPRSGVLTWKPRSESWFRGDTGRPAKARSNVWNGKYAGKRAFYKLQKNGYLVGSIFNVPFYAHRVAFAIHYGRWPLGQIDHIDGDRSNNKIDNLRDVTQSENNKNLSRASNNTSGHTGVCWDKSKCRWMASIKVDGRSRFIGRYKKKSEAVQARKEAESRLGFASGHGKNRLKDARLRQLEQEVRGG